MAKSKGKSKGKPSVAQRKAQSARDKAKVASRPKSQRGAKVYTQRPTKSMSQMSPYAKLTLDPCEAKLTSAPIPGRYGAQAIRLPYRAVLTVPSGCNTLAASIFPHAMQPFGGSFPAVCTIQCLTNESSGTAWNSASGGPGATNVSVVTPQGLGALYNISSELRPIAGCVRLGYIGAQGNNAGAWVAYEGPYAQLYGKQGSSANPVGESAYSSGLQVPVSTLALDAWTSCDTTKSVEAKVNIAAADPYWQTFRATGNGIQTGAYVKGQGQLDSCSLTDPDLTGAPVATVAISGAVTGTQYLLTGAIVYEWVPNVTLGMPAPQRSLRDPKTLQTTVAQLAKYGRMLVGLVAQSGANPPGLMLDLAMKAFSSLAVGGMTRSGPLRLGM